jgi:hypothetical protein
MTGAGLEGHTPKLECTLANRCHHLLKTFWRGWRDEQFPDRRVAIDSLITQRQPGVARADQMREGGLGDQWLADRGPETGLAPTRTRVVLTIH